MLSPLKRYLNRANIPLIFVISAAGHLSDALIANKWTVLSVRRLMTSIGLLGPGIFLLFFSAVNNILLAVM